MPVELLHQHPHLLCKHKIIQQTSPQRAIAQTTTTLAPQTRICQQLATPELTIESYQNLGDAYYMQHNFEEVIFAYDCVLELNAYDAHTYAKRGIAHVTLGHYDQAFQDYNTALSIDPTLVEAYINRGRLYTAYGRIGEAMLDFELSIIFAPNRPLPYYNRGTIYAIQGDYNNALADFNYALQLDQTFSRAHIAIGTVYMMIALDNYGAYQQQTGTQINQPGGSSEQLFVALRDNMTNLPTSTWYSLQVPDQ